jgi:hypothetical protein
MVTAYLCPILDGLGETDAATAPHTESHYSALAQSTITTTEQHPARMADISSDAPTSRGCRRAFISQIDGTGHQNMAQGNAESTWKTEPPQKNVAISF